MGKRQAESFDTIPERRNLDVGSDKKTSEVKGSGRFFFALAKILVDVIDDELQVSDAHKCAGKKVDNGKRVGRVVASAVSKVSVKQAQGKLGSDVALNELFSAIGASAEV